MPRMKPLLSAQYSATASMSGHSRYPTSLLNTALRAVEEVLDALLAAEQQCFPNWHKPLGSEDALLQLEHVDALLEFASAGRTL